MRFFILSFLQQLEAASRLQLSSMRTEPRLVQSSKEVATAARERVLALLPTSMAHKVRAALLKRHTG